MAMDQEVDLALFVTCRLCLDEPGSYQIIPCIERQIKYCFGIEVDRFDGLPQLICKKCKGILADYYSKKNMFVEKQKQLHDKLAENTQDAPLNNEHPPIKSPIEVNPALEEKMRRWFELTKSPLARPDSIAKNQDAPLNNEHPPIESPIEDDPALKAKVRRWCELTKSPLALGPDSIAKNQDATLNNESSPIESPVEDDPALKAKVRRWCELTKGAPAQDSTAKDARKESRKSRSAWKKAYNKMFVCTICSKSYATKKSIKKHSITHKRLIHKHEKVFKNYLTVRLNKIDKKKNITGCLQNVVYNKNKIIERGSSQYSSLYLKKDLTPEKVNDANENEDFDDEMIKGKKRKTGRLESTSSAQTVIVEESKDPAHMDIQSNSNETGIVNTELINLDDTSSDCPQNNTELVKKRKLPQRRQGEAKVPNNKAIQNIVTMCHKNYNKKKKIRADTDGLNKSTFSESSLKHKVLSLGRKVLNKQEFSCTGLLRYMEHKGLDITWSPTDNEIIKKGSNFVRLMTKSKSLEDSENDDACWKNLDISFFRDSGVGAAVATANDVRSDDQAPLDPAQTDEDFASASCETNDINYRNKLLNKTPVANPRQLHKKNISETKVVVNTDDPSMIQQSLTTDALDDAQVEDNNMCLPIITSTTSLSLEVNEKERQEVPVGEKPAPRIKVKPASELMSARALNNYETVQDLWAFNPIQSSLPQHLENTGVSVGPPVTNPDSAFASNNDKEEQRPFLGYILLDSPQFPNTKTTAPFHYFRKVLLVHALHLLDLNKDLPDHFTCLIKFKLMLKQDTKRPIALLLSLYCSEDTFCFSFKDKNFKRFDPNQLPAFWQWELLKIYKTDVGDKILQNAINVGKDVHENTKLFLCLLKSIDLIKEA